MCGVRGGVGEYGVFRVEVMCGVSWRACRR